MITLEDLWDVLLLPAKDAETGEKIDSEVMAKNRKCPVIEVSCDANFNILVKYEKEPEDD